MNNYEYADDIHKELDSKGYSVNALAKEYAKLDGEKGKDHVTEYGQDNRYRRKVRNQLDGRPRRDKKDGVKLEELECCGRLLERDPISVTKDEDIDLPFVHSKKDPTKADMMLRSLIEFSLEYPSNILKLFTNEEPERKQDPETKHVHFIACEHEWTSEEIDGLTKTMDKAFWEYVRGIGGKRATPHAQRKLEGEPMTAADVRKIRKWIDEGTVISEETFNEYFSPRE